MAEIMDTLAVSFMLLSLAGSVAAPMMFIVKNKPVKDFCFYFTAVLGILACVISISLFYPNFMNQLSFALLLGALSTASILLWYKYNEHTAQGVAAQIMAVFSFMAGLLNAFAT